MASVHQRKKLKALSSIRENERCGLLSLPTEMLSEIVIRVDESSYKSLAITKLSCKDIEKACESRFIYQRVCLNHFPIIAWFNKEKHRSFFNKCLSAKNPEALYRQGVMDYFYGHQNTALEYLKEAADDGHKGASYMMALIFLRCKDDKDLNQKGVTMLLELKKEKKNSTSWKTKKMEEYRLSLHQIMREISWTPNDNIRMKIKEIEAVIV